MSPAALTVLIETPRPWTAIIDKPGNSCGWQIGTQFSARTVFLPVILVRVEREQRWASKFRFHGGANFHQRHRRHAQQQLAMYGRIQ